MFTSYHWQLAASTYLVRTCKWEGKWISVFYHVKHKKKKTGKKKKTQIGQKKETEHYMSLAVCLPLSQHQQCLFCLVKQRKKILIIPLFETHFLPPLLRLFHSLSSPNSDSLPDRLEYTFWSACHFTSPSSSLPFPLPLSVWTSSSFSICPSHPSSMWAC